jgi:putative spermidine/putrescine transport system ATP-binding protein
MITRYLIELEAGGELQVVRQNQETPSGELQERRGRKVKIGWRADQTVAVEGEEEST